MQIIPKKPKRKPNPGKLRGHGAKGEQRVRGKISRIVAFDEQTKHLNNIIFVDGFGNSHQIYHIIIRSNGVFVIETKNWLGWIMGKEDGYIWTQCLNHERYTLSNPIVQNKIHCQVVDNIIGPNYHSNSVIVMAQNNAKDLKIANVVNSYSLKRYVLTYDDGANLSVDEIDNIYNILLKRSRDMTREEHIKNINRSK